MTKNQVKKQIRDLLWQELTEKRAEFIYDRYLEGYSQAMISALVHLSEGRVSQIIKEQENK
jgi:DNA-directed RNA polymerase specialized sigma24 family protein